MTATLSSPSRVRRPVQAALALLIGLTMGGMASATDLKPPAGKLKSLRDRDVTIVIIDDNDRRSSSRSDGPSRSEQAPVRAPSGTLSRDDDEVTIRVRRDREAKSGTIVRSGPKIIIVDQNSRGCGGSGVCVIRP